MQPRREEACGKILCVFLGGAAPHRFALSTKGSRGAASLSSAEPDVRCPLVFSAALPARQMGGGVMSPVSTAPRPESLLCSPVE